MEQLKSKTFSTQSFRSAIIVFILTIFVASFALMPIASAKSAPGLPKYTWTLPKTQPRVLVMTIHGGSWFQNEGFYQGTLPYTQSFTDRAGAVGMNVEYTSGPNSLPDLVKAYDIARNRFPNMPICAYGWSAGGNLALLLANQRKLACVISEAGPTDLINGSTDMYKTGVFWFGADKLGQWSPMYTTKSIQSPTLIVSAVNDELMPHQSQAVAFKKKFTRSTLITLNEGPAPFIHTSVNAEQLANARSYQMQIVRSVAAPRP